MHVYKLEVNGLEPLGNAALTSCTGSDGLISGTTLYPYNSSTANMFINPSMYHVPFNVSVNASTKLIVTGPYASQVHNICAIDKESFGVGTYAGPGVFTWKLPIVARNPGEIVRYPASEAEINTGG